MEFNVESRVIDVVVYDDADKTDIIKYASLEYLIYQEDRNQGVIKRISYTFPPPDGDFVSLSDIQEMTIKEWISKQKQNQEIELLQGMKDEYLFKHGLMRKVEWQT